ncbi:MAG TPA: RES domain-containing protein [Rhodanobacter sp.]|nr:RES domain-containing protein [Rhodanobacter sp.]
MSKHRRPQAPPKHLPVQLRSTTDGIPGLLELDRFSEADLDRWNSLSQDLDELHAILYSGIEPQRQRHHAELIAALRSVPCTPMDFTGWVRMVPWRYADTPLSSAGSLKNFGGRFNLGADVDNAIRSPWPALYVASNQETAYREKFGLAKDDCVDGLSAEELVLTTGGSYSAVRLDGHLELVFDLALVTALDPVCKVLRKITQPAEAGRLQKRLQIPGASAIMIRTAARLIKEALAANWRVMPAQFGIPAVSQILAGLIIDAGYEAIRYPSTKSDGECVAIFPHRLASDASYVVVADDAPASTRHTRLDLSVAEDLCGWEVLPRHLRPVRP